MKEGLLDEKGKPNDKTPSDWYVRYKEFNHYGQTSPNGQKETTLTTSSSAGLPQSASLHKEETTEQVVESGDGDVGHKKKKKKKGKDRDE